MAKTEVTINGARHVVQVDDDMPLLWILRETLGLTGTKFGCGVGVCGACTVLENGNALRSCQIPCSELKGRSFITIEGLSPQGNHPCQQAWLDGDVAQVGCRESRRDAASEDAVSSSHDGDLAVEREWAGVHRVISGRNWVGYGVGLWCAAQSNDEIGL